MDKERDNSPHSPSKLRNRSKSKSVEGISPQPDGDDIKNMTPGDSDNDEMDDASDSEEELENIWSCDDFGQWLQENFKEKYPEM